MVQQYINRNVDIDSRYNPHRDKTISKDEKFVINISDPNMLSENFASYTTLFTLSALSEQDLRNTDTLLKSRLHDIIIRSGGIGPNQQQEGQPLTADNKKIIEKNERLQGAIDKSQATLRANRDLYFRSVTMNNIPGLNEQRRLTSVTQIKMEIVEPSGISLLEKIRGAAINNNYLDHLDAPFMLSVDFQGFDERGQIASKKITDTMKRRIPIKIVDMQMDVNQAGTVYTVSAIPYNEFAYMNRYNYPRTTGTISPDGRSLRWAAYALQDVLNKQNEDESKQGLVGIPDTYQISIHEDLNPDEVIKLDTASAAGMLTPGFKGTDNGNLVDEVALVSDVMKISPEYSIIKVLEELMKGHPDFTDKKFKQFKQRAGTTLNKAQRNGGAEAVAEAAADFYFPYFRIRSSVIPTDTFDPVRGKNVKKIIFTVDPYKVHAYSLAIPGVSTGQNFKNFVFKTYNYIFTGDNIDVLDLNIDYKVAYFTGRLKDFPPENEGKNTITNVSTKSTQGTTSRDMFTDGNLHLSSEVTMYSSASAGRTQGATVELDAFLDSLSTPLADMVNIRMEILGDPAWLGQSQYMPATPELFKEGAHRDTAIDLVRGNKDRIWNDKLRCYNPDLAEPIILLNFRMPTDFNDKTGVYDLQSNQSAEFSGLYRVVQIEHNFSDGKYTNVLQLTRFNNQGVNISNPEPTSVVVSKKGEPSEVLTKREAYRLQQLAATGSKDILESVTNLSGRFNGLINNIRRFFS